MKSKVLQNSVADAVVGSQDLGINSQKKALNCIKRGWHYKDKNDPLTAYLVAAMNDSETLEDFSESMDYAISQLQKAQHCALYNELKIA